MAALFGNMRKDLWRGRIGDAREIDFQKLRISRAVIGRVQHAIDIVEDLHFIRGAVGGVCGEALQLRVEFGVEIDAAGFVEILLVGVEVEGAKISLFFRVVVSIGFSSIILS